jgi:intraflagellar transport protein 172
MPQFFIFFIQKINVLLCSSQIHWLGGGNEKFYFNHPGICLIFNAGELSIVEYGSSEIVGACRTEHMNPNLIR